MVKARDDICRLVATKLGINTAGQQADGATFSVLQTQFDGIFAELQGNELIAWGADQTPDEVADSLAVLIAQRSAVPAGAEARIVDYYDRMGQRPYLNFVAVAGRRWSGAPTSVDRF